MIDIQEKKNKIISFLETSGPSIPVRIARAIEMEPVFTSAILSELLGAQKIKTSNLRLGSSPLYHLPGQEKRIEEHTENLKPIENEAYQKLKNKKILTDENEEPAIRVALRNIKDFAEPFKFKEKIMWKYKFASEEEIKNILTPQEKKEEIAKEKIETKILREEVPKAWKIKKEEINEAKEESKKIEAIFTKPEKNPETPEKEIKKEPFENKTFLKEVEEFLEKRNTKIISIQEVDKKKVIAKTEKNSKTSFLFAFNKKRISEEELIKCYRQAKEENLEYRLILTGELTKKMNETIEAYKKLLRVDNLQP